MKKSIFAALALSVFCACAKDNASSLRKITINATFEGSTVHSVKTSLAPDGRVLWGGGNGVTIFSGSTSYKFTVNSASNNSQTAVLDGTAPQSDVYYGLYPYSPTATISDGVINYDSGSNQNIQSVENFAGGQNISFGKSDADGNMTFYNACALLKFFIPADVQVTKLVFSPNNTSESFRGRYSLSFNQSGELQVAFAPSSNREISAVYNTNQTFPGNANYFVVVPPVTFSQGYSVTISYADGSIKTVTSQKSFTFARNTIYFIGNIPAPDNSATVEPLVFDNFETGQKGTSSYYIGNVVGTNILSVVPNPYKTGTNGSDYVLLDEGSKMTYASSSYFKFKISTYPGGQALNADVRAQYSKLRVKVYLGDSGFTPLLQEDAKSTKSTPCEINGVAFDTANPSMTSWNEAIKTNDWNVFVYDITGPKYSVEVNNFAQTEQLQFRVSVNLTNQSQMPRDVYFDDFEFIK